MPVISPRSWPSRRVSLSPRERLEEAQDFYDNDEKLTFTCYRPKGLGGAMGLDLKTGKVTDFSQASTIYNEIEGIFPDGKYSAVESSLQVEKLGGQHGSHEIDIWKLRLDGTGKDFVRLR